MQELNKSLSEYDYPHSASALNMSLMSTFAGDTATRIYCVREHGKAPKPGNTRGFSLAAEAEAAGYRPCTICRPYKSEPVINWAGPELVCRAVRLILGGALDEGTEEDLGRRLGISARHLRRLFGASLGLTPTYLARSVRAHFARRLLDDTDLTAAEIAFAAGFGSIRQFNRTITAVFHDTPLALRGRRLVTDRLVADGGIVLRIHHQEPLDWSGILAYSRARAIKGVESIDGDIYRRTVEVDGDPGVIELSPGAPDHLLLRVHLPHHQGLIHIVQRVRRIFNLDADVEVADSQLSADPIIGPLVRRRPGLRPLGTWDAYEAGVQIVAGGRVGVRGASRIMARIVQRHGVHLTGLVAFGLSHLFPAPNTLANADFRDMALTGSRADAIKAFARAVASETGRLDGSIRLEDLTGYITSVWGLSPRTAQYLAMRSGDPDAFPATDPGLTRSISRILGRHITPGEAEELAERWRPWRAHAVMHLWLADEMTNAEGIDDRTARSA